MAFSWAFVICSCVKLSACSIKEPVFPLTISLDKCEVYLMCTQDEANMFLLLFYTFFLVGICRLWLFKYLEVPQHLPSGNGNKCGDKEWVPNEPGKMDCFNRCDWGPSAPCLTSSSHPIHHTQHQVLAERCSPPPIAGSISHPSQWREAVCKGENQQQILCFSSVFFISMPWELAFSCHRYLAAH